MRGLDHLIVVAPSLESGVSAMEGRLGVKPKPGGRHEGWGTRNALLCLGGGRYLEILAPDPEQSLPVDRRFLRAGEQSALRLATWVAQASNLDEVRQRADAAGVDLGEVRVGGRRRPDGTWLAWRLLGADQPRLAGLIPFFIDWGDSPHPSSTAAPGCELRGLRARHPEPGRLRAVLAALDLDLVVEEGEEPGLIATIECPSGLVELQ